MSLPSTAHALLAATPLAELQSASRREVVTLEHSLSINAALAKLAKHGILSAPMVLSPDLEDLEEAGAAGEGPELAPQLLGWVDVAAILRGLLDHVRAALGGEVPTGMLVSAASPLIEPSRRENTNPKPTVPHRSRLA